MVKQIKIDVKKTTKLCNVVNRSMILCIRIDVLLSTGIFKILVRNSEQNNYLRGSELLLAVGNLNSFWDIPVEKN